MPVIIVGADTDVGLAIVTAALRESGEVRAFVTDGAIAEQLRRRRVKVAVGADGSHLASAATNAHTAVLVFEASGGSGDGIDRNVVSEWVAAVVAARVKRIIGVGDIPDALAGLAAENAVVAVAGRSSTEIADEVVGLDAKADW